MMMMMMRGDPIYRFFAIICKEEVSAAEKKKIIQVCHYFNNKFRSVVDCMYSKGLSL
jgi:hypothetical protein